MNADVRSASLTSAVVLIGGYQLPLAVLLGAIVGASLFMLHAKNHGPRQKWMLFGVALMAGLFIADDINPLLNAFLPTTSPIELGQFLCAAIAALATEKILSRLSRYLDSARFMKGRPK